MIAPQMSEEQHKSRAWMVWIVLLVVIAITVLGLFAFSSPWGWQLN
jgi:hypothetical protein